MLRTYGERRQATVAEWVTTRPIFDLCVQENGFEGGGRLWVPWLRKKAVEEQMRVKVEAILAATRVRRRQEYGWRDGREGVLEGVNMDSKE